MDDNCIIDICILFGYMLYNVWQIVTVKLCTGSGLCPNQLKKMNWISIDNGTNNNGSNNTTVLATSYQ